MARIRIDKLHQVRRDTRGGTVWYVYAWRGGPQIWKGPHKLVEIAADHPAAEALRRIKDAAPATMTIGHVVDRYEKSPAFGGLSPSTQADYVIQIRRIRDRWAGLEVRALASPRFRALLLDWRDAWATKRPNEAGGQIGGLRAADKVLGCFGSILAWALERGLVPCNPAEGVRQLHDVDLSDQIWEPDELEAMRAACAAGDRPKGYVWDAVELAHLTGLSRADAIALPESAIKADRIVWRRKKTGREIIIPRYPALDACLERIRRAKEARAAAIRAETGTEPLALTVLTNSRGRPWKAGGFDTVFGRLCAAAGVEKRFHDLRGTAATQMAAAGLTDEEIAMIVGWEPRRVASIKRRYVSRNAVVSAAAERLKRRGQKGEPHG